MDDRDLIADSEAMVHRFADAQQSLATPLRVPIWSLWQGRARAELWQVIALSMGYEPIYRVDIGIFSGVMSTHPAPVKPPVENRPPGDTRASYLAIRLLERLKKNRDFCWRLELAADHLGGDQANESARVTFAAVAELAKRMNWQIPEEFAALAGADALPQAASSPGPAPAPESSASLESHPVASAVVSDTRRGLLAPKAARAFANLAVGGWGLAGWARAFQDPSAWLLKCRVSPGSKGHGGKPSAWCPLAIACALVEGAGKQEPVPLKTMHARFTSRPELAPWRDEWDLYFLKRSAFVS